MAIVGVAALDRVGREEEALSDHIYVRVEGHMEELSERPFDEGEDVLQELIAKHPDLLSGDQIRPEAPRRWILVTREQVIKRWAVDHLLIDQDARPTLVEVKRRRNPEVRRSVVGQLLEYAAHARQSWDAYELRRTFEEHDDARDSLRALLGGDEPDADEFWKKVETNLRASNLRLLFVADEIPDPLAQVVGFLNEQMRDVEVLAVEIKRYGGGNLESFVPRVIGRLSKPTALGRPRSSLADIIARFPEGAVRDAAQRLIDRALAAGATVEPGSQGLSIRGSSRLWSQPVTVAWLYPSDVGWQRTRHFSFGAGIFEYEPEPPEELSEVLRRYARQFEVDSWTHDASSSGGVVAWCVEPNDAVKHIDVLVERVQKVLADLRALAGASLREAAS